MRVAVVDDSALFRRGLVALLAAAGMDIVREARDGGELLAFLEQDRPDVVVLDIRMPPTFTDEGLRTAEQLRVRDPRIGVLVLSTYNETAYAVRLVEGLGTGVGYLLKDRVEDVDTLCEALERVQTGQLVIDPEIVTRLVDRRRSRIESLTAKESEVLRLMAEGRSNAGIGRSLGLSARTVEAYVANVFDKLDLTPDSDANRRILAVLTWLRTGGRNG